MPFLVMLRVGAALVVTLFGVFGVVSPLLFVSSSHTTPLPSHTRLRFPVVLSLANCFAGGMLITIAIAHFFLHALEDIAAGNVGPSVISFTMLGGVLLPAVIERGVEEERGEGESTRCSGAGHSHGSAFTRGGQRCIPLVLLLMFFHAAMEGALLGVGVASSSLLTIVVPLCVHRMLDGVAIGVAISKKLYLITHCSGEELLPLCVSEEPRCTEMICGTGNPACVCLPQDFNQRLRDEMWRWPVLLWLAITPVVALLLAVFCDTSTNAGENYTGRFATARACVHQASPHNSGGGGPRWTGSLHSLVAAAGGGLFLFAGLMTILREEARGLRACASILLGVGLTLLLSHAEL